MVYRKAFTQLSTVLTSFIDDDVGEMGQQAVADGGVEMFAAFLVEQGFEAFNDCVDVFIVASMREIEISNRLFQCCCSVHVAFLEARPSRTINIGAPRAIVNFVVLNKLRP